MAEVIKAVQGSTGDILNAIETLTGRLDSTGSKSLNVAEATERTSSGAEAVAAATE